MKRHLFPAFLVVVAALSDVWASPVVSERDPLEPFRRDQDARAVLIEYFTASKNGDAARASGLIDYEEWAKALGLDGDKAKEWAQMHRRNLVVEYGAEKAAGSTKVFKVLKETMKDRHAVFEVTQGRVDGIYLWQVELLYKNGRWAIVGYRLLDIDRAQE
ncbi:MAG: hypothetical protein JW889_14370 [Verrucomicrobia bacterium]|nr:hypothetical protein [Verrucomicrobiota bacterium]